MLQYIVFLGAFAQAIGIYYYIKETIKGNIQPNKVTWLFWSIAPLIATAAAFADGVRLSVIPVFMAGFGPLVVFGASFINPKSYWKLEKFDYLCGLFSLFALAFWGITKMPAIAIVFAIVSDILAGLPTFIKSWRYPETETMAPYYTGIFCYLTSFLAIKLWVFSELAFPIYLVIANGLFVFALLRHKFVKKIETL